MPQKLIQTQTQTQQQKQVQTMTPLQLLGVRLLEMPVNDLETRVQNELLDNSALEESDGHDDADAPDAPQDDEGGKEEYSDEDYKADSRADYADDDDTPDYLKGSNAQGGSGIDPGELAVVPFGEQESLYENLMGQIGEHDMTDKQRLIVEYLIGSLDSDGLLRKEIYTLQDELSLYQGVEASEDEIREALSILQRFDPPGIGARSLQECMEIQLRRAEHKDQAVEDALYVVTHSFNAFIHKNYSDISMPPERLEAALATLRKLNPRPGSTIDGGGGAGAQVVVPDFEVTPLGDGEFDIQLNNGNIPALHVSQAYRDSLKEYAANRKKLSGEQKATFAYMKERVDSAQNFINAIRQRSETMLNTMRAIVELQRPFFEDGDEAAIQPMILKDVAARTGQDISTVSRVTQGKFVSTPFGVYPLKRFFSNSFVTKDGDTLSKNKIKARLKEIIDGEDKKNPLADDAIAALMKKEGYPIARRTVTKYRIQMGIPVARLRR